MKIEQLIRKAREQFGVLQMSYTKLEHASGIHRHTIRRFLYNDADIKFTQAMAIFEALEIKIEGVI